jgi:N-acetylglutamate synthase-like GNAT family acetyltransferase
MQANAPNLLLIRRYRSLDQDAVCALHQMALEAVGAYAKGPQGSLLNADLNDIEGAYLNCRGEFLVGSIRNRIVAMGALKCLGSHVAEITRMRVHPDYWRRGYVASFGERCGDFWLHRTVA